MELIQIHVNREAYLEQAVLECRPFFDLYTNPLPQKIRVSCGIPSNAKRSGAIGECHSDQASKDKSFEIFIHPKLDNRLEVFEVLVHELCHTLPGAHNHGRVFQKHADALGLVPVGSGRNAYKSTKGGAQFKPMWAEIIDSLGAYPHKALTLSSHTKQGTRMLKAVCPTCNYSIRTSQHWVDKGLPVCSADGDTFILA